MSTPTIPDGFRTAELDAFLGELIGGQGMDRAVAHAGGDGLALRKFARECGFPSRSAMREIRAGLAGLVPAPAVEAVAGRDEEPAGLEQAPASAPDAAAYGGSVTGPPPTRPEAVVPNPALLASSVAAVVKVGKASTSRSIRAAAERFEKAHADLVRGLHDYAETAQREKRIAELQAELARLRGKPARSTNESQAADRRSPSAVVRVWAAENGVPCPTHGKIPQRVQEEYDAAQEASDA